MRSCLPPAGRSLFLSNTSCHEQRHSEQRSANGEYAEDEGNVPISRAEREPVEDAHTARDGYQANDTPNPEDLAWSTPRAVQGRNPRPGESNRFSVPSHRHGAREKRCQRPGAGRPQSRAGGEHLLVDRARGPIGGASPSSHHLACSHACNTVNPKWKRHNDKSPPSISNRSQAIESSPTALDRVGSRVRHGRSA